MIIIKTKKDIAAYITTSPVVLEFKRTYKEDSWVDFEEVTKELARQIASADGGPDFGDDWEAWLADNIQELLEEAVSIVM